MRTTKLACAVASLGAAGPLSCRPLLSCRQQGRAVAAPASDSLYRHDGVRITHDPYAQGMAEKYGAPGKTDGEGFDPYADSVGAGIYSGTVQRREDGSVIMGKQYQNHNPRPGPVYSGGGYTPMSQAIRLFRSELEGGVTAASTTLGRLLDSYPDLVNDVSTGGALPLHTCGMSRENQYATAFLISRGGDIEAVDTYGFTPLHRMASNNLAIGARALLSAGADPGGSAGAFEPMQIAQESEAAEFIDVVKAHGPKRTASMEVVAIVVFSDAYPEVSGRYTRRDGATAIPSGFADVCNQNGWGVKETWLRLNGGEGLAWFAHEENESYIYFNGLDGKWWIDGIDGLGKYKASGPKWCPPGGSIRWEALDRGTSRPTLAILRRNSSSPEVGHAYNQEVQLRM